MKSKEQEITPDESEKFGCCLQKTVMRLALMLIVFMVILMLSSCMKSEGGIPLAGNEYVGTLGVENVRFSFEDASNVEATITSSEFVGHFKDVLRGTYTYDSSITVIHWTAVDEDNDVYTTIPPYDDTITVDASKSVIILHTKGNEHELKEYRLWGVRNAFRNADGFGDIVVTIVLCIILTLAYTIEHWYITLPILIIVLASLKHLSNRKKEKIWNKK